MIDVKELRIGNLVYSVILKSNFRISQLIEDYHPSCNPIPLTPEILIDCGFKYGTTGEDEDRVEFWDLKTPEHKHSFGSFYFSVVKWYKGELTFSHQSIRSDCKYVHQLQNLYFALTGKELIVTL